LYWAVEVTVNIELNLRNVDPFFLLSLSFTLSLLFKERTFAS